jgi:gluconolactonase
MNRTHNTALTVILIVISGSFAGAQSGKSSSPVSNGATPLLVSSGFLFTEGPAADADGNVFFTDQPNDRIMKWSPDGTITVFMEGTGRSNGLFFDKAGTLYACADLNNQLWRIDKSKKVTVLIDDFAGKKLNGPNDLWVDPNGGIYFTDPFYKRDYWTRTEKEIEEENVYYFSPEKKLQIVATGLLQPNGIIGTPDGKKLYVADIKGRKTYSFSINEDGTLSNKQLFADIGSDGMTIDSKGNVYLTGRGVTVFSAKGDKIETIDIDAPWTANVCFGGKDRKLLFITASKSVFTLKMKVKGAY